MNQVEKLYITNKLVTALQQAAGIVTPEQRYQIYQEATQLLDEWRAKHQEWRRSEGNVEVDWSGSEGCHSYYVHCAGLELSVEWSEQIELNPSLFMQNQTEADRNIKEFCDKAGIEYKQPAWHLASRYF